MGNIVLLDDLTINKIAAGEVIERPASVVKELIENSIDAGATNITAEIKNGGITYIRITDNGKGLLPDDMEIAFERHATSKIRSAKDLELVKSMGFRGEALASIAAIAHVELTSKTEGSELGYKIVVEGGKVISKEIVGCPKGTTIIVENLFFNTPVRYKFLKKDFTELGYIEDAVTRLALVNPDIAIKLINLGKSIIQTTGNGVVKDVIYSIYGKDFAENIINIDYKYEDMRVVGCIGNPSIAKNNRTNQVFFVNKRYVKDKVLSSAAEQAFKAELPIGKYGFLVLNIEIDSHKIDVNVHPAKLEIRFQEENQVFKLVYHAIKEALLHGENIVTDVQLLQKQDELDNQINITNSVEIDEEKGQNQSNEEHTLSDKDDINKNQTNQTIDILNSTGNLIEDLYNSKIKESAQESKSKEIQEVTVPNDVLQNVEDDDKTHYETQITEESEDYIEMNETENKKSFEEMYEETFGITKSRKSNVGENSNDYEKNNNVQKLNLEDAHQINSLKNISLYSKIKYKFIGIAFSSYIVVEIDDELYIINQKSANESLIYERIRQSYYSDTSNDSQQMLLPDIINLSQKQMGVVKDNIHIFEKAGFDIEEFGENTIKISGAPDICIDLDTKDLFLECINKINTIARTAKQEIEEKFLQTMASKIAQSTKMATTFEEVDSLMQKLLLQKNPFIANNEKGIAIKFSKAEIDKKFQ